ncbi:MAG: hypothetical protein JEZ06_18655 [Anaerolineaceae bacterium]|nr:hypothetical protein [Anaerolineaceae bacterium]
MDIDYEERKVRDYLHCTPREEWPEFLKNCKLRGESLKEYDPMKWGEGFEADMYWYLFADILNKLTGYVKKLNA